MPAGTMKPFVVPFLVLFGAIACSSSSNGPSGTSPDAGGSGQDATPPLDDSGDPPADAGAAPVCVSDAGAPSADEFGFAAWCTPGNCLLEPDFNGAPNVEAYGVGAYAFDGTTLDADFGTGGHVHMVLGTKPTAGQAVEATGTIKTPAEGPMAGSTLCLGDGTHAQLFVDDGGGQQVRFIARCVSTSCGTPNAEPLVGEIIGCCRP